MPVSHYRGRQDWTPGNVVKVGFLQLRILGYQAIYDGMPDVYTLSNIDGNKFYEFIPHNGLSRIDRAQALENEKTFVVPTNLVEYEVYP